MRGERGNTSRGSGRGRSRLIAEEPDVGLDPITPGSRPEPKADAQPLCHPGAPILLNLDLCISVLSQEPFPYIHLSAIDFYMVVPMTPHVHWVKTKTGLFSF